ncbi:ABC transporter permease [Kitasatospora sp. LaBMicrA B282]|uniref:ABC transporter permease n=1 Tax=Kitasatospora sp. LaBMicrA B282 TaxID=3420949 RepID=UPI003D0BA476
MADTRTPPVLRLLGYGLLSSYQDYRAMFTWRSWAGGWLVRLICQVLFFATLGRLLGSAQTQAYIAFGNAAVLGPLGALGVVSSTAGERRAGTLQFLLITRSDPFLVLASRGLYWVADGLLTSTIALVLVPLALPVPLRWAALPAIVAVGALTTLSCYCLALALAGLSVRRPQARMYLTAGTTIALMLFAGVTTDAPRTGPWAALSAVLPVTHGLSAMRALAQGHPAPPTALLAEAAVGLAWGVLAHLLLGRALRHTVRTGTLALS